MTEPALNYLWQALSKRAHIIELCIDISVAKQILSVQINGSFSRPILLPANPGANSQMQAFHIKLYWRYDMSLKFSRGWVSCFTLKYHAYLMINSAPQRGLNIDSVLFLAGLSDRESFWGDLYNLNISIDRLCMAYRCLRLKQQFLQVIRRCLWRLRHAMKVFFWKNGKLFLLVKCELSKWHFSLIGYKIKGYVYGSL